MWVRYVYVIRIPNLISEIALSLPEEHAAEAAATSTHPLKKFFRINCSDFNNFMLSDYFIRINTHYILMCVRLFQVLMLTILSC